MNPVVTPNLSILSFLYDFDLLYGENVFRADIDLVLNGRRKIGESTVSVTFSDNDERVIIRFYDKSKDSVSWPLVLDSTHHSFNYIPGITLQVEGLDPNPSIGKFRVLIFPKT